MANKLGIFDPIFYAQLALIQLEKALGMAGRVHRGYDKTPNQKGSTISIQVPSTFTAQDAPGTDQDIITDSVDIKLDQWKEVKFALTDKELNYTQNEIIEKHIRPAAYAIADNVDQALCNLALDVPWTFGTAGNTPAAVSDITGVRKVLFNNSVPLVPGLVHLMIDGNAEDKFLQLAAFSQNQGAGQQGVDTQLRGTLGTKFGLETFANQNVITHTAGTADHTALLTNGAAKKGDSSISLDAVAIAGTLLKGDILSFAGMTQKYTVQATATAAGNAYASVSFSPKLTADLADGTACTVTLLGAAGGTSVCNLAFHNNAFALAMAPLSDMASQLGAKVATVTDPVTGLSIRSRVWYVGDSSAVKVGLDVLYGVKTLNGNLAARLLG